MAGNLTTTPGKLRSCYTGADTDMSVVDQILLFQSAEFIISPHGAGLSNLLFCEPGTKVIELTPSVEVRPFFWMISDKLDLVHGMLFCTPRRRRYLSGCHPSGHRQAGCAHSHGHGAFLSRLRRKEAASNRQCLFEIGDSVVA